MTIRELVEDALMEIGVVGAQTPMRAEDAAIGLRRLNQILDSWNADRLKVYADAIHTFPLVTGTHTTTIGPTGDYVVTQRPVSIEAANVILETDVRTPIAVLPGSAWMGVTVPEVTATFPTNLYYEASWPNGTIYQFPIPTTAYTIELQVRVLLTQVALTDTFSLPPGYQEALSKTLAEDLVAPFGMPMPARLPLAASQARARIQANNDPTPALQTKDAGMPPTFRNRATFNYRTGMFF